MRDISRKIVTLRTAIARATVKCGRVSIDAIRDRTVPKGDPLEVARVAAVNAAKQTSLIIPYCHPVPVDFVGVEYEVEDASVEIVATVKAMHRTGVEMEALTAASVAALTVYDMLKMIDEHLEIEAIRLVDKRGGKSDFKSRFGTGRKAAVLVLSDSIAAGQKEDTSGRLIAARLEEEGLEVSDYRIVPDDRGIIVETLKSYADDDGMDLVVTTGGTGFSPRDMTPEATREVIEREVPGIAEAGRAYGQDRTPYSMLSRGLAGIRGRTLIVNLPGSRRGVAETLDALFPGVLHAFKMLAGGGHEDGGRRQP